MLKKNLKEYKKLRMLKLINIKVRITSPTL